ncbi:MAG: GcvT family protein, partial [Rhodospirillaceae bacterium]|nr:GcvT family protein [Rhodospirillaceae bacterium]
MNRTARAVVIGGGVTGCGLLYHLAKLGWTDCLLVEKNDLTAGATWHAAGHVAHYSASALLTRLQVETTALFPALEAETGQATGFHRTGAIRLATQPEHVTDFKRALAKAKALGVEMEIIGPDEIKRLFPFIETDGLIAGAHTFGDGHADPTGITMAYAIGARAMGAKISIGEQVESLTWLGDEWEVVTNKGTIRAEVVINCAGMWSPEIAAMVGVTLPLIVFMHQHMATEDYPPIRELDHELPLLRDPAGGFNMRQEGGGFLSGVYEHEPEFVFKDGIPPEFGQELMTPNLDRSTDFLAAAMARIPAFGQVGIKTIYNGPTSRTPDHQPMLGPVPGVPNHFIAAGYAAGIMQAGFTKYLAQWIAEGEPEEDMSELDVRRFGIHADRAFTFDVVHAGHTFSNAIPYPYGERAAGRPARTSALYDRLNAEGAVFGVRNGWEVANWFAGPDDDPAEPSSFRRPRWQAAVGREVAVAAEASALADFSYLSLFKISGPGAEGFLETLSAASLPAPGRAAVAPFLTKTGRVATCLRIARTKDDEFLLIGPGEHERRDHDWLWRQLPADGPAGLENVRLENESGRHGILLLTGPKAGEVLRACGKADIFADLSDAGLPEGGIAKAGLGYAPATVIRLDETGCGDHWLLTPMDFLRHLHDAVAAAGEEHGLRAMGLRAWDSLRLERAVPAIGLDADRTMTPAEAGLGALVAGGSADDGDRRMALLRVASPDMDPWRNDVVWQGDNAVALIGSGGYGHRAGASLGLAALPAALAAPGTKL